MTELYYSFLQVPPGMTPSMPSCSMTWCWVLVVVVLVPATGVDPESGGTVQRLLSQQQSLIQPGLSFINSSSLGGVTRASLGDIRNLTQSAATVSATINIVNWSRWLLGYPVYYFKYGHFQHGEQKNRIVGTT